MDARLATNRRNWNQRVPVHAASSFYDLAGFKAGRISLNEIERREVGPVAGKTLLHLLRGRRDHPLAQLRVAPQMFSLRATR